VANAKLAPVVALGCAQTLAWASSYYLPAVLATPIARDLGVATPTVFAAFSVALLVSAALGPHAGRAIEDCFAIYKKADRAAVFAGWRDMNDYMRENKIEPVPPQLAAQAKGATADAR